MSEIKAQPLVLMYHGVITEWTAVPEERETGAELYDVHLDDFQRQMESLKVRNFNIRTLDDDREDEQKNDVILTFDDGEMNNYELALPVLKKFGYPAYFFIIAQRIGNSGYMGWEELKGMHEAGMVIGSHGFSHEILTSLLDTQIDEELSASKKYLERNLGIEVDTISIPRGFCDDNVIQRAYDAGYKRIFISDRPRGLQSDCYSRTGVKSNWTIKRFNQSLTGDMPLGEKMYAFCIKVGKRVFGSSFYNWIRSAILKVTGRG